MFPVSTFSMGSLRAPGRPSRGNTLGCLTERSSKPNALHAPHRTPQLRDLDILLAESRGCARDLGISRSRGTERARVVGSHSCSAHCLRLGPFCKYRFQGAVKDLGGASIFGAGLLDYKCVFPPRRSKGISPILYMRGWSLGLGLSYCITEVDSISQSPF